MQVSYSGVILLISHSKGVFMVHVYNWTLHLWISLCVVWVPRRCFRCTMHFLSENVCFQVVMWPEVGSSELHCCFRIVSISPHCGVCYNPYASDHPFIVFNPRLICFVVKIIAGYAVILALKSVMSIYFHGITSGLWTTSSIRPYHLSGTVHIPYRHLSKGLPDSFHGQRFPSFRPERSKGKGKGKSKARWWWDFHGFAVGKLCIHFGLLIPMSGSDSTSWTPNRSVWPPILYYVAAIWK